VHNNYTHLVSRGMLECRGPAAREFLQGQTTCDFNQLTSTAPVSGAYCTPQGRIICDFRALQYQPDHYLLQTDASICGAATSTFGKYIVFSKAELSNATSGWRQYGFWGEEVSQQLAAPTAQQCWREGEILWLQSDDQAGYFEACVPASAAAEFEQGLDGRFEQRPESEWSRWQIDAGIGHVEAQTSELFLPQMLNYQATRRISFDKGCYTGQEVIARLHYRGKTKRPMYLARLHPAQSTASAGNALFRAGREQSVGTVVNVVSDETETRLLAAVASDAVEIGVFLGSPQGARLEFLELPYELET
jgi:folate-binding protein YgfZ